MLAKLNEIIRQKHNVQYNKISASLITEIVHLMTKLRYTFKIYKTKIKSNVCIQSIIFVLL